MKRQATLPFVKTKQMRQGEDENDSENAKLSKESTRETSNAPDHAELISPEWRDLLGPLQQQASFLALVAWLETEYQRGKVIYPPRPQIYHWTSQCSLPSLKVIILGQDPYHGPGQAMGLAFSVPRELRSLPPSLLNIYKELETDIAGFKRPSHGCLEGWARQGVLLLNASLTVNAGEAASHAGRGWEPFTEGVIRLISRERQNLVFLLWGNHAIQRGRLIEAGRGHLVLKAAHPSPLSAHRGFFGCRHFSTANRHLQEHGLDPIDWSALD